MTDSTSDLVGQTPWLEWCPKLGGWADDGKLWFGRGLKDLFLHTPADESTSGRVRLVAYSSPGPGRVEVSLGYGGGEWKYRWSASGSAGNIENHPPTLLLWKWYGREMQAVTVYVTLETGIADDDWTGQQADWTGWHDYEEVKDKPEPSDSETTKPQSPYVGVAMEDSTFDPETRAHQARVCWGEPKPSAPAHRKESTMFSLRLRKMLVVGLIVGVSFLANIVQIVGWLDKKGIVDGANYVRKEYLTGTALTIVVALLILIVNPKWRKSDKE